MLEFIYSSWTSPSQTEQQFHRLPLSTIINITEHMTLKRSVLSTRPPQPFILWVNKWVVSCSWMSATSVRVGAIWHGKRQAWCNLQVNTVWSMSEHFETLCSINGTIQILFPSFPFLACDTVHIQKQVATGYWLGWVGLVSWQRSGKPQHTATLWIKNERSNCLTSLKCTSNRDITDTWTTHYRLWQASIFFLSQLFIFLQTATTFTT